MMVIYLMYKYQISSDEGIFNQRKTKSRKFSPRIQKEDLKNKFLIFIT